MTDVFAIAREHQSRAWEVIRDGVRDYEQFVEWEKSHPEEGIFTWMS